MNRPNFIFILTDDQGWEDLQSFGHPYLKTPNLDRLADEGTSFTQSYVSSPVCSPSRVSFMTGHYPARHNVHHIYRPERSRERMKEEGVPPFLDPETTTLTGVLRENGYVTGHFGKWHMGNVREAPPPSKYGIDDARVCAAPPQYEGWPEWRDDDQPYWWARSTDLFVDETIRFIEENQDRPFYVNLWSLIPHAPLNPTPEQLAEYDDLKADPADFRAWMRPYLERAENLDDKMKIYCASMTSLDTAIGRLLDYLDQAGLAQDTFIFFTSDNGPEDYCVGNASNAGVGSPGQGRARKRSIYEGGVRTPSIARWPGRIPAGRVDDESVIGAVDWFPTVCQIAGVTMPHIQPDGENILDVLSGNPRPRKNPLFWEWKCNVFGDDDYHPPELAVREGDWKLFMNPNGSAVELYDLVDDPTECEDVAADHPGVVERLTKRLADWKSTLPDGFEYGD